MIFLEAYAPRRGLPLIAAPTPTFNIRARTTRPIIIIIIIIIIIAFDVGRTLPNTDLSRDFMGLVVDGSMDLGTHIWHPTQIFFNISLTTQATIKFKV